MPRAACYVGLHAFVRVLSVYTVSDSRTVEQSRKFWSHVCIVRHETFSISSHLYNNSRKNKCQYGVATAILILERYLHQYWVFFSLWPCDPMRVMASSFLRFLDHTQRRITVGRTPLDEWLARRRDLYLTTHNTHNRQISMPQVGFEPTISANERSQTYALDRAATGTGQYWVLRSSNYVRRDDNYKLSSTVVTLRTILAISSHYFPKYL